MTEREKRNVVVQPEMITPHLAVAPARDGDDLCGVFLARDNGELFALTGQEARALCSFLLGQEVVALSGEN